MVKNLSQPSEITPGLIAESGELKEAAAALVKKSAQLVGALHDNVLGQVAAYTNSSNPNILPELEQHLQQHVEEVLRLMQGEALSDLKFVEEYAKHNAEQFFPLEAILHMYRCNLKVFSRRIREAALEKPSGSKNSSDVITIISDFIIEYSDAVSTTAARHYIDKTQLLADVASDQRSELLTLLLEGYDEADGRVTNILRDAGYLDQRQSFCVILAQSIDPTEMHSPPRARRLADYIDKVLQQIPGKRLVDIHRNKVTIIFSHMRRVSGWTAPQSSLAHKVSHELLKIGTVARIGVSNDVPSTSQIPSAYIEASLAFDNAGITHRVIQFSDIPLQHLLLHLAGEDFKRILPAWANSFFTADNKSRNALSKTLIAYANQNMNVIKAARQLKVHSNTIYSRFDRINTLTGLDARSFKQLNELLIVAHCRGN